MNPRILEKLALWKQSPLTFVTEAIGATPSEQQIEALVNFPKTKRLTIRSGHGCHAAGTIVLMANGTCKLVEDVKIGDQLMGNDSASRNVLELYRGREQMYRIQYYDGTYYDVNASHKLALRACRDKNGFKKGDITVVTVKDYLNWNETDKRTNLGFKEAVELPEIPVIIPPYILGLWLGDGWHNRPAFTSVDKDIIRILRLYAGDLGLNFETRDDGKSHYISPGLIGKAGQNVFLEGLKAYDLIGNKHIPIHYLLNSKENRLHLLAGLLDSDGWLDPRNKRVFEITQKREDLAQDILFLAQSVGCHATVKAVTKTWRSNGELQQNTYYRINISRNTDIIPTQLLRKKAVQTEFGSNLNFGFKVIPLEEDNYYGFEVDGNHLYMLADFTVTRNTGKDACASWIVLWFMTTRAYPKVVCTAPTARQLADILWSEISKWLRKSILTDEFILQKDKMFHKDAPKEWWCRAVSPSVKASKEEQAETLAGFHGDHLLIIADEASGIPDPVYIPLEGAMTQEDNKVLLIGNMTRNTGYFYDTHFHNEIRKDWKRLHWDSRYSSNVDPSYPKYMATKYGEESNVFRIRVTGDPPLDAENTLIPLAWALQCIGNETLDNPEEPLYLGVDVARYGEDKSIILPRQGLKILPWEEFSGMNTISLAGHVVKTFNELKAEGAGVDEIGVGAGVIDWLHKKPDGHRIFHGISTSNSSSDITKYNRLRDELWVMMREKCMKMQYSFPAGTKLEEEMSNELCNELAAPTYDFNLQGGYKVESKRQMKIRGVASPNIADALGLTEYFYNIAFNLWGKLNIHERKKKSVQPVPSNYGKPGPGSKKDRNWMAA
jgi:hypothetical protein